MAVWRTSVTSLLVVIFMPPALTVEEVATGKPWMLLSFSANSAPDLALGPKPLIDLRIDSLKSASAAQLCTGYFRSFVTHSVMVIIAPMLMLHSSQAKPATLRDTPVFLTSVDEAIELLMPCIMAMACFIFGSFSFSVIFACMVSMSCLVTS